MRTTTDRMYLFYVTSWSVDLRVLEDVVRRRENPITSALREVALLELLLRPRLRVARSRSRIDWILPLRRQSELARRQVVPFLGRQIRHVRPPLLFRIQTSPWFKMNSRIRSGEM